jgi:glutaredoxin-like protein
MALNPVEKQQILVVYGSRWCGDCTRTRRFLDLYQIEYEWINIDRDRRAEKFVIQVNHGYRSVPTLVFPDGAILTEPSNAQLAEKLQLEIF